MNCNCEIAGEDEPTAQSLDIKVLLLGTVQEPAILCFRSNGWGVVVVSQSSGYWAVRDGEACFWAILEGRLDQSDDERQYRSMKLQLLWAGSSGNKGEIQNSS